MHASISSPSVVYNALQYLELRTARRRRRHTPPPPSPFVCVLVLVAAARRRSLAFDLRCLIGVHTSFSPSCVDIMTMRNTLSFDQVFHSRHIVHVRLTVELSTEDGEQTPLSTFVDASTLQPIGASDKSQSGFGAH